MTFVPHFPLVYAALWLATFLAIGKHWKRFFVAYAHELDRPRSVPFFIVWAIAIALLATETFVLGAAIVNLGLAYFFFQRQRWTSLLRGMGAPGAMLFWLSAALFFIELTRAFSPQSLGLTLRLLQIDLGLIMLSSSLSKLAGGYFHGEGMEYGLVNPAWSRWANAYSRLRPSHPFFKVVDHGAWLLQFLAGIFFLFPLTGQLGAWLVILGFAALTTQVRLGLLCESVILAACLFLDPMPEGKQSTLSMALTALCAARAVGMLGLWYNFYSQKRLASPIQKTLDTFAAITGLSLWRVFTVDSINFCVRVESSPENQVAESIALASLFSSLKYYPSRPEIFRERLLRYARAVGKDTVDFRYFAVRKREDRFEYDPVAHYTADTMAGEIRETLIGDFNPSATHPRSSVHECAVPGTFAPAVSS